MDALQHSILSFLGRHDLTPGHLIPCLSFLRARYPGQEIRPIRVQGFCSITYSLGDQYIIQIRPRVYPLDLETLAVARDVYGNHAPSVRLVKRFGNSGLEIYEMSRVQGISLLDHRLGCADSSGLKGLVDGFAEVQILGYKSCKTEGFHKGLVGKSLEYRLKLLERDLPVRFRPVTRYVVDRLDDIVTLPWVFTHGDLVPGNIMVNRTGDRILGLVDWTESEWLPCGMGFYGLDIILGEGEGSAGLKKRFWERLEVGIHVEGGWRGFKRRVELARILGILLWFGIAWDEGRRDRVVEEGRDFEEVERLDAFLGNIDVYAETESKSSEDILVTGGRINSKL
ncbi:Protein kinase-like (PK-like) [Glarea lozoyensis ATCC 20868]|uniref:Protein kinase-like (PK-like) n=1 Tax=Glarea lozoyensis (strain ATCC 20868 / MF5171) TaxID=1116229 RepID=S3DIM4_GLAL2|nr:Protein kinase-like (PK-like) [Glarea lozoyensis ATCC 20868]EPE31876.1 Protein kinase-like (PK-like) [Glarea lozoyensis ATCC 20868]